MFKTIVNIELLCFFIQKGRTSYPYIVVHFCGGSLDLVWRIIIGRDIPILIDIDIGLSNLDELCCLKASCGAFYPSHKFRSLLGNTNEKGGVY